MERATHVLVQISDPHLVPEGPLPRDRRDPHPAFAAAVDTVLAADVAPAAVLLTGDLAEAGDAASYRRVRAQADRFAVPVLAVAGNHDDRAALREHLLGAGPSAAPLDTVVEVDGLRIVVLDSTVPGHGHGELRPAQLSWLAAELARPAPHGTVLALHHPPLPSTSRFTARIALRDRAALAAVLAGTDVRIVLAGHTHVTSAGALAGIPVWTGAATSAVWDGLAPAGTARVVHAPVVSRVDLFDGGEVIATAVPVGAPVANGVALAPPAQRPRT